MSTPGSVLLRPARVAEAATLAAMSRTLIESGLDWRYTPQRMQALLRQAEHLVVVASDDGAVAGFAAMHFGDMQAHLVLLCVRAQRQRQGLGRRLHDWLLASARVAGMREVGLELRADNAAALQFYLALGYTETHSLPGYYDGRVTARRMRLRLA